jgi:hypothetical protein
LISVKAGGACLSGFAGKTASSSQSADSPIPLVEDWGEGIKHDNRSRDDEYLGQHNGYIVGKIVF